MYGLLAFVSLILLAVCYYVYAYASNGNILALIGGIIFLIATIGFGGVFLSGRVNKKEEIHITE
jgi:ABC-type multidrug transport system permease subunit